MYTFPGIGDDPFLYDDAPGVCSKTLNCGVVDDGPDRGNSDFTNSLAALH